MRHHPRGQAKSSQRKVEPIRRLGGTFGTLVVLIIHRSAAAVSGSFKVKDDPEVNHCVFVSYKTKTPLKYLRCSRLASGGISADLRWGRPLDIPVSRRFSCQKRLQDQTSNNKGTHWSFRYQCRGDEENVRS